MSLEQALAQNNQLLAAMTAKLDLNNELLNRMLEERAKMASSLGIDTTAATKAAPKQTRATKNKDVELVIQAQNKASATVEKLSDDLAALKDKAQDLAADAKTASEPSAEPAPAPAAEPAPAPAASIPTEDNLRSAFQAYANVDGDETGRKSRIKEMMAYCETLKTRSGKQFSKPVEMPAEFRQEAIDWVNSKVAEFKSAAEEESFI